MDVHWFGQARRPKFHVLMKDVKPGFRSSNLNEASLGNEALNKEVSAMPGRRRRLAQVGGLIALLAIAGCGMLVPGTPGHEPTTAGNYNPVSMETNSSGR